MPAPRRDRWAGAGVTADRSPLPGPVRTLPCRTAEGS
jgi:hypothetical protein